MFHSDCGWPTCQVVSLGGTGEGAALLLSRLVAGQRGLWTHESRGTFHQLWGKAKHTESRSAEKADDRHICNLIFTFKKLFKLTERTTLLLCWPQEGSVSTYRHSLSGSSAVCTLVDRYTHSSPESWCIHIYSLHDLCCIRQYLWINKRCLVDVQE